MTATDTGLLRDAKRFSLSAQAAAISDVNHPNILGECNWGGPAVFGVARLPQNAVDGLWEQHDHGDELLVVISGNFTFRMRLGNGVETTQDVAQGDVVFVPKGAAHTFQVHSSELQILFVTPKNGNHGWDEHGNSVERHQ